MYSLIGSEVTITATATDTAAFLRVTGITRIQINLKKSIWGKKKTEKCKGRTKNKPDWNAFVYKIGKCINVSS